MSEEKGKWRTIRGRHIFIRDGQKVTDAMRESGKFRKSDIKATSGKTKTSTVRVYKPTLTTRVDDDGNIVSRKKKMTSDEKIASVHLEVGKDNVLPELNDEDLAKLGVDKNKPVLVKANIIEKMQNITPIYRQML